MSGSGLEEGLGVDSFAGEVAGLTLAQIEGRRRMETENARHASNELRRLQGDTDEMKTRIRENEEKIKVNRQLPYLVASVVEVRAGLAWARAAASCHPPWPPFERPARCFSPTLTPAPPPLVRSPARPTPPPSPPPSLPRSLTPPATRRRRAP